MEDYKRKLFTIPTDLCEKLEGTSNQSGTVAEALRLFFSHKDTVRRLAGSVERIEERLRERPAHVNRAGLEQTCCELQRPDPGTHTIPCKHWFWTDGQFRNVLSGEIIEV